MPVDQELTELAAVASLLTTDLLYLVRDPGGAGEADHKVAVSVLDTRFGGAGAVTSVFGRSGVVAAVAGDYNTTQITGISAFGQTLIDDADAVTARATLALGTMATQNANAVAITGGSIVGITDLAIADGGTGASTATNARTNLGLIIGTDVQAFDAELAALAGLVSAADKLPYFTGSGTAALADLSAYARSFLDDANEATFKATVNLEIGVDVQAWDADLDTIAGLAKADGNFIVGDGAAWVVESGATVRTSLGLGSAALNNAADFATAAQGALADTALQAAAIGVSVQAFDADLAAIAALAATTGMLSRTGAGAFAVRTITGTANRLTVTNGDGAAGDPTLDVGANVYTVGGTDIAIADGGTGQSTAQLAINALTNVAAATNEYVLTKDTASGNAIFKAAAGGGGSSLPVADTQTLVMGSADNTKLFRIEVDGFTAGATRVMTPPNQDFSAAGLDVAQTFSGNQTFSQLARFQGPVSETATGIDRIDAGVQAGTPRMIFENAGYDIWQVDNEEGTFRWFIPGSLMMELDNTATNTAKLDLYHGNASRMRLHTNGTSYIYGGASMALGVGTTSPQTLLHVGSEDATLDAIINVITIDRVHGGTPVPGWGNSLLFQGTSTGGNFRQNMGRLIYEWATATHASRKARGKLTVFDTAEREGIRIEANGSAAMLGFYGTAAVAVQTVTGSRGGNAALADLLTKLATLGLIIDGSSA